MVDPAGEGPAQRHRHRGGADPVVPFVALERRELLRISKAFGVEALRKDHRGGHERPGEGTPPHLVDPGDQREPLRPEAPLELADLPYDRRSHPIRDGGQMMTKARPMTLS